MSESVASPARMAFNAQMTYFQSRLASIGARNPGREHITITVDDGYGCVSDGNLKPPTVWSISNPHFDENAQLKAEPVAQTCPAEFFE